MVSKIIKGSDIRWDIFRALLPFFGTIVTPSFLRRTQEYVSGIERVHPLIEGIYKPKWSRYALSIASMQVNPYSDKLEYLTDGRWRIRYSAKSGGTHIVQNKALVNCMTGKEPVIVLLQTSNSKKLGVKYRLLGLGLIHNFDPINDQFDIHHIDSEFLDRLGNGVQEELLVEYSMREAAFEEFHPFVEEKKAIYKVSKIKREQTFKKIILEQYDHTCSVTGIKFKYHNIVEAQAAHIISKSKNGSDDPRNGLALSNTAHWAFDKGIFTISDQYEIIVNPKVKSASLSKFPILEKEGQQIDLPGDQRYYPHQESLKWHREEVFSKFGD